MTSTSKIKVFFVKSTIVFQTVSFHWDDIHTWAGGGRDEGGIFLLQDGIYHILNDFLLAGLVHQFGGRGPLVRGRPRRGGRRRRQQEGQLKSGGTRGQVAK